MAASGLVSSVGIRPNSSILTVLSHLNYKPWFALAEFVDNSIQSYLANKERLQALHGRDFKLEVRVRLDSQNACIEIADNAAGIRGVDFPRAFRPAEIPPDRTGLSEFGMGMKTAACWFTHTWSVRTKALDEDVERQINFDLGTIVAEKLEALAVSEYPSPPSAHYTVVRLEHLGKKMPVKRTIRKIRDHLASIYRQYLRQADIVIYFDEDNPLTYDDPAVLQAPPYNELEDAPVTWRQEIDMTFPGNRRVTGFAAIRKEASTTYAGFALFRRSRLIQGSDDETYRPAEIFGNTNSFRYQRLFGELNLEGFEVSHTKDGFRWDDLEEVFLERLKEDLRGGIGLLKQADNYRVRPTKAVLEPIIDDVKGELIADLTHSAGKALERPAQTAPLQLPLLVDPAPSEPELVAGQFTFPLTVDGQLWEVCVETGVDPKVTEFVRVSKPETVVINEQSARRLAVFVSLSHPFVQQYLGPKHENVDLFVRVAVAMGLSSQKSAQSGFPSGPMMLWFNKLLRETLSKTAK